MATITHQERSATLQLRDALRQRGYVLLAAHQGARDTAVLQWLVYIHAATGRPLVLQTFREGSCELYKPVVDSNSLAATIAAIP